MKNNNTLSIRLSDREKEAVEHFRVRLGLSSMGEAVRRLIREAADEQFKFLDLMSELDKIECTEGTIFVSKEHLKAYHDKDIDITPLVRALAEKIAAHIRQNGWPMPPQEYGLGEVITDLKGGGSRKASALLKSRFLSFWSAGDNPAALAADSQELEKLLRYRCGINQSREMFDISFAEVRRAVTVQHRTVSFFQPKNAFDVYKRFVGALDNPKVWDPSAGFGARLLGFYAACPAGVYYGNEPAQMTYEDNVALAGDLGGALYVAQQGSEFGHPLIEPESLDFVFTSPPYFNKEKYFAEESQAWFGRTEKEWMKHYLQPTLDKAFAYLKNDGLLVLNVDVAACYKSCAEKAGFLLEADEDWEVRRHHFARRKNKALTNNERLLIWRKHGP